MTEGLEIFHETLDKLNSINTPNQKEKVETDLKKEIKKLQRLRDQIKGWQQLSEIKDKQSLNDARKSIETEMERFKVLEKEMKIKAFSKEGLNQAAKLDPKEKERLEMVSWISETVDKLNTGIDAYEAEMESLRLGAKKNKKLDSSKQERLNTVSTLADRHKWHVKKLELIRRLLENERLETDDIEAIKEDLEYYLEAHAEPDFVENEELYDELDLATSASEDDNSDSDMSDMEDDPSPSSPSASTSVKKVDSNPEIPIPIMKKPSLTTVSPPSQPPAVQPAQPPSHQPLQPQPKPVIVTTKPKISGPSFASAASAATTPLASPTTTATTTTSTVPVVSGPIVPPISFAAAAKPVEAPSAHRSTVAGGYEELVQQLTQKKSNNSASLLSAINSSWQNCPDGFETESSKSRIPRNPATTIPDYYPTTPPSILDNPAIFERLDLDTLFFIFYYQQKSYPQYLAARELKRQSWRFHKKYLTWFQRHEEPKSITDEYEQGTYIYFDYESSWCQRKKTEFTFEYRFLEDEETV